MAAGVVGVLATGALCGAINAVIVIYGRLQPIVTTIATGAVYYGAALALRRVPGGDIDGTLGDALTGRLFGWLPASVVLLLALVLLIWLPYRRSEVGRAAYAIGSAEVAAYMSGVPIRRAKFVAYTLSGLLAAFEAHPDALFAAPQCWTFDGRDYEGMRTRVRSRFGLVQGMSRVPGHLSLADRPDLTAAAGPVLAVDRVKFLTLGGYDSLYHPGRIEDLDLGFRGWMAGWRGYYVPESLAYHRGFGSFGPAFGASGCDRLALRNTLLFAWKNLGGRRLAAHLAGRSAILAALHAKRQRPRHDRRYPVRSLAHVCRAARRSGAARTW